MDVRYVLEHLFQKLDWILTRDERVAGVEINLNIRRAKMFHDLQKHLRIRRERTVRFNVENHLVILGHRNALSQVILDNAKLLFVREPGEFCRSISCVDAWNSGLASEHNPPAYEIDALPAIDGKGDVELRSCQTEPIKLFAQI